MTARVTPYAAGDEAGFAPMPWQLVEFPLADIPQLLAMLADAGSTFTLRGADGRVLAFAGVARLGAGLGHGWAVLSHHAAPAIGWLTRVVRRYLDGQMPRYRRIEAMARSDYPKACKWARLLGFTSEGVARCLARDGGDMERFARINRKAVEA